MYKDLYPIPIVPPTNFLFIKKMLFCELVKYIKDLNTSQLNSQGKQFLLSAKYELNNR